MGWRAVLGVETPTMTGQCLHEVLLSALVATVLLLGRARCRCARGPGRRSNARLRGATTHPLRITLIESGSARVCREDAGTGTVTTYGSGISSAIIASNRFRRRAGRSGAAMSSLLFGVQSTAVSSDGPDLSPHRLAAPDASPASGGSALIQSERLDAPIIGSGQPRLNRLGISRGAVSQAIEWAIAGQELDNRDN